MNLQGCKGLTQKPTHDITRDISQPIVAAGVPVGEAFMIETKKVEDGRMEVVNMHRIFTDIDAEIIRLTIDRSCLDASTRKPARKDPVMVLSPVRILGFDKGCATDFSGPNNQRVL